MHELSCVRQVHAGMCANLNLQKMTDFLVGASDRLTLASSPHAARASANCGHSTVTTVTSIRLASTRPLGVRPLTIVVIASVFRDF